MNLKTVCSIALLHALSFQAGAAQKEFRTLTIALIGDSTVCNYPKESPKRGWGQLLGEFLAPGTKIVNEAKGGASSASFPAENWRRVREAKPDFVFIQFGHNDMKKYDPKRYTDPGTTYRDELKRFIRESREVGATPVLVTPVSRRTFRKGQVTRELLPYADAAKAVGLDERVKVVDLNEESRALFQALGAQGSERFTANKILNPDAKREDRTHFTEMGAREMARLVAAKLPEVDSRLAAALATPPKGSTEPLEENGEKAR